jgi:Flp pilus assembly protein TadG
MRKLKTSRQRLARSRKGASAVEFAVISPLFFLLLAGILEFGQAFRIQHALSSAARQGARAAVIQGATASLVSTKVRDHCTRVLGNGAAEVTVTLLLNGQVTTDLSQAQGQDMIEVKVSLPFSKVGIGFYANTFVQTTLSSSCTFERE